MLRARWFRIIAVLASLTVLAAACGGDDDDSSNAGGKTTTTAGGSSETTAAGGDSSGWQAPVDDCPDEATQPIDGTIKIGTTMPLSGGAAAVAFAPVASGFKAYMEYANENKLVKGHDVELTIEDDQYNASLTTPAVEKLIDDGQVNMFAGMIGTPNNLAVRDTLNEECYPQIFALSGAPAFGDVANYPWTMGGLPPYNTETKVYVEDMVKQFPDGAKVAIHHVNSEFGDAYAETLKSLADDAKLDIVSEQTIEAEDSNPPSSQVSAIAAEKPDIILAVPLGAQCPTFMTELAKAEAANAGWTPRVYITSTCAIPLILQIAGPAAEGLFTISSTLDVGDPKNADNPKIKEYTDFATKQGIKSEDFVAAAAGWATGESVVAVLAAAAEKGDVTRASIMEAARSLKYTPSFARPGVTLTTDGEKDGFPVESFQVIQWDATAKVFKDVGDVITKFEGKTEVPEG